ncbi:hypothetical protein RMSM_00835 [Rhodopirellula maiorica SM1]|uniref:Uncharacterized protein n=1 Tax=Rhodopirellula maiorica SM1 TaxID=1265738 RepID=M5S3N1_9BACT|nr:hypothetical protein RMSM_00835 [Rhodopirellula maiorica SM1]
MLSICSRSYCNTFRLCEQRGLIINERPSSSKKCNQEAQGRRSRRWIGINVAHAIDAFGRKSIKTGEQDRENESAHHVSLNHCGCSHRTRSRAQSPLRRFCAATRFLLRFACRVRAESEFRWQQR